MFHFCEIIFKIQLNTNNIYVQYLTKCSLYTESLRSESLWGRGGAIFPAPVRTGLGAHPAMQWARLLFPERKLAGAWRFNTYSSYSVEVIERVELDLHYLSGSS